MCVISKVLRSLASVVCLREDMFEGEGKMEEVGTGRISLEENSKGR